MILSILSLASLGLAQTQLTSPITSLSVDFKDSDLVQHFYFDTIEIKLGFAIENHVTEPIQKGDYFEFDVDGNHHIRSDYTYDFDILDSAEIPVFHVTGRPSDTGFSFKATATDYFTNNDKQPIDGQIILEVATVPSAYEETGSISFSVKNFTSTLLVKSHYHPDYLSMFSLSPDLSQISFNAPVKKGTSTSTSHTFILKLGDRLTFSTNSLTTAKYFDEDRFETPQTVQVKKAALLSPSSLEVTITDIIGDPIHLVRFEQDLQMPNLDQTLFCASVQQDGHVIIDRCISTGSGVGRVPGGSGALDKAAMKFQKQN